MNIRVSAYRVLVHDGSEARVENLTQLRVLGPARGMLFNAIFVPQPQRIAGLWNRNTY